MAVITARSAKRVSYHDLHNLSTADEKKGKSLGFFEAER